jgi:hypothetical protein
MHKLQPHHFFLQVASHLSSVVHCSSLLAAVIVWHHLQRRWLPPLLRTWPCKQRVTAPRFLLNLVCSTSRTPAPCHKLPCWLLLLLVWVVLVGTLLKLACITDSVTPPCPLLPFWVLLVLVAFLHSQPGQLLQ